MYDLVLQNCKIVNENKIIESDIAIKNNRIELISNSIDSETKKTVDLDGKYVLPGLIDDQVHFREPGLTHKGDIATESRAGLAGGVTSYFEMPNVNPTTTTNENLSKKFDIASTKSLSNYSFHLGASNTNIEEIKKVDINGHLYLILKRVFLRFRYRRAQMGNDAVIAGQHRVLRCHAMDFSRRCVRHRNAGLYVFGIDHGRIQP